MNVPDLMLGIAALLWGAQGVATAWEYSLGWRAYPRLQRHARRLKSLRQISLLDEATLPPVTVVLVVQNNAHHLLDVVRRVLRLRYPQLEWLIVNDGSNDQSFELLLEHFSLKPVPRFPVAELGAQAVRGVYQSEDQPQLWLIDKEAGGVPDALNAGLNFCQTPLVAVIDAGLEPDPQALLQLIRPFLENTQTGAVTGRIHPQWQANALPSRWARFYALWFQREQLLHAVEVSHGGHYWQLLPGLTLFKRASLVDTGGFPTSSSLYLTEAVLRLHQLARLQGEKLLFYWIPDPVGWQAAPPDRSGFVSLLSYDVMAAKRCWLARRLPGSKRAWLRHIVLPLLTCLSWLCLVPFALFQPMWLVLGLLVLWLAPAAVWQQTLLLGELTPHRPERSLLGRFVRDAWVLPLWQPWFALLQWRAWHQPVPPPALPPPKVSASPVRGATQRLDGLL